ncbi:IMEF encapsulin system ferritin-like cargo protein [Anaerobacillus sp. MEB173]|uniref:IMEF encapsulin system ferritin-like cargo protein n=1 Tax=Anaerobacillus sp. MEB173 TaxID=3383345 RepID=UPI003F8F0517
MSEHFGELKDMFLRTQEGIHNFMSILTPRIENASDEHERLYYHHIYEEEEQRLDRLNALLPKLDYYLEHSDAQTENNYEFIRLLQDISLEKFGLHNFLEHLDLSLFSFKDTEYEDSLTQMRNKTNADYQAIKGILNSLNDNFDGAAVAPGSVPTDEKEDVHNSLKVEKYSTTTESIDIESDQIKKSQRITKRLTVGSLKEFKEVIK